MKLLKALLLLARLGSKKTAEGAPDKALRGGHLLTGTTSGITIPPLQFFETNYYNMLKVVASARQQTPGKLTLNCAKAPGSIVST